MTSVNIYLTFDGNCEEAFNFYRSVFGGEFPYVGRFKDMPAEEGMPPMPAEMGEKIMHITLPISNETCIMGSDAGGEWGSNITIGNNFSISVNTDSETEATRIFNELSAGGNVTMPLNKTFWGAYFGMLTDKFGINWMVNCELAEHKEMAKTEEATATI
ncbi:MAG: VOC family protein, partial [Hymenobacteraceae bacterium]|nr:VOC family protein [Hymenobacteraceae bacterium]MDX5397723.1 VOC family protein [Hymenobacteraceae bacterium]MDX5444131.1 VOC family protein [Hymenobacteraceae bacterium]MDX5513801.1 VOC family protein [Hymenobacteraceae bacterium]